MPTDKTELIQYLSTRISQAEVPFFRCRTPSTIHSNCWRLNPSNARKYPNRSNSETVSYRNSMKWTNAVCLIKYVKNSRKYSPVLSTRKWKPRNICFSKRAKITSSNKCSTLLTQVRWTQMGIKKYRLQTQRTETQGGSLRQWNQRTRTQKPKPLGLTQSRSIEVCSAKGEEGVPGKQIPADEGRPLKNERPQSSSQQILWKLGPLRWKDGVERATRAEDRSCYSIEPAPTA